MTRVGLVAALLTAAALMLGSGGANASPAERHPLGDVLSVRSVFEDVPADSVFVDAISWLVDAGIADGYGDGNRFQPTAPVSRQAAAAFLYRFVSGGDRAPVACEEGPFVDVDTTHQFCGEIAWMARSGIAGGYEDGTFRPTAPVSRQAIASFIQRFASDPGSTAGCEVAPYDDVEMDHRFCDVIRWLTDARIAGGFGDGTFRPTAPVSRQAMAAFLHRIDPTSRDEVTISGGHGHNCWLEAGGLAECRGIGSGPHIEAPPESFVQITAGTDLSCGLRGDGTATCWGFLYAGSEDPMDDDHVVVPDGLFTQVVGGGFHACGLRIDGTATCWGHPEAMESFPPPGPFTQLAAGEEATCGLRSDGVTECWWNSGPLQTPGLPEQVPVPTGVFERLAVNASNLCGVRTGGAIECWSFSAGQVLGEGPYVGVAAGEDHACGLLASGEVECWSNLQHAGGPVAQQVPEGSFTEIAASWDWTCGRRAGGEVLCWDDLSQWDPAAP